MKSEFSANVALGHKVKPLGLSGFAISPNLGRRIITRSFFYGMIRIKRFI